MEEQKFKTIREVKEELEAWFDSIEFEEWALQQAAIQAEEEAFYDRWCEKVHNLPIGKKRELVAKINAKYDSDAYKDRFWKHPAGPREPYEELKWVAYEYAKRYGKEHEDGYTAFVTASLIVDDEFVIERLDGQGSFIKLMTVEEAKVEDERCRKMDEKFGHF